MRRTAWKTMAVAPEVTKAECRPCSVICVISPNFKHGCLKKIHASHLNVPPEITFIQFASRLPASMVSSHTCLWQPTGVVWIVKSGSAETEFLVHFGKRICGVIQHDMPG